MKCQKCHRKKPSEYMYIKVGYIDKVCKNCFVED